LANTSIEVGIGDRSCYSRFDPDRRRCHHVSPMTDQERNGVDEMAAIEDAEIVDGLPVLAEVRAIEPASAVSLPAVQAAAAAATGFVAGAATLALVRRRSARRLSRGRRTPGGLSIVNTRSFLVDVHLIAKPGE
jgi:hypothetical protein